MKFALLSDAELRSEIRLKGGIVGDRAQRWYLEKTLLDLLDIKLMGVSKKKVAKPEKVFAPIPVHASAPIVLVCNTTSAPVRVLLGASLNSAFDLADIHASVFGFSPKT